MRAIVVPLCVFGLFTALFLGIGGIDGSVQAKPNLTVAAGELRVWDSWTINPCKYEYRHKGMATIPVTIKNLSGQNSQFDMGDGTRLGVLPNSSHYYEYRVHLRGEEVKYTITKVVEGSGIMVQESLVLKIVPISK